MQVTIIDIAREAGVSTATVSRVLNSNARVNEDTRDKVMAAVRKYNYSPSTIARGLKIKSMKTIAIVVKSFTMLHHMRIADVINSHFSKKGYDVMIFETGEDTDALSLFTRRMLDKSIDGIIFIGSTFQVLSSCPDTESLFDSIPVVIANGWIEGSYGILVDEKDGAKRIVEHLASRGKDNILFIHVVDTESARNKWSGIKEKTEELGICRTRAKTGNEIEEIEESLSSAVFDAVICEDDILAAKTMRILQKQGRKIPDDVAVVGFNDSEYSILTYPPLTTLNNKAIEQGEACADVLEKILNGDKDAPKEKKILRIIYTDLVVRETT